MIERLAMKVEGGKASTSIKVNNVNELSRFLVNFN